MYNLVNNKTLEVIAKNSDFDKLVDRQNQLFFEESTSILSDADLKVTQDYFRKTLNFDLLEASSEN